MRGAVLPDLALIASARVHEATGQGRIAFAMALAGCLSGPVLWVRDRRSRDELYAPGMGAFLDPARLVLAYPTGQLAVLQAVEEALRSGAAPLVVAELAEAPDLTASRRLQLAAGTGGGRGLCLLPEARLRANAAETRWRCEPVATQVARATEAGQRWELMKNKRGRPGAWTVRWDGHAFVEIEQAPAPA